MDRKSNKVVKRRRVKTEADSLTPRQIEVMNLVKLGFTDMQIAIKLGMGVGSVKGHLSDGVFRRLGAVDRANAVYICMKRGIIE